MKYSLLVFFLASLLLSGCGNPSPDNNSSLQTTPTLKATISPTETVMLQPSIADQATTGPVSLRIWLPPIFDPTQDNSAARLLRERLNQFQTQHNIQIQVRIKSLEGEGGMINALTTTSSAANLAMPDLVALPRPELETAALKGLLLSIDEYTDISNDPDWFEYAHQLARIQDNTYGIPFAGNALVMLYRPRNVNPPPTNWNMVFSSPSILLFPASDPQAFFPLAEYLASGGAIQDTSGQPMLDINTLTNVFTFFQQAQKSEKMPYWLSQFENDEQIWQAYQDGRASSVITWSSRYLRDLPVDTSATFMPSPNSETYSLVTGWVWALTSINPERRALSVELAQFLTTSDFLAAWSEDAGYLPPRPSSLNKWHNIPVIKFLSDLETSAHLTPPSDVLVMLGQILEEGTIQVLKQEKDASTAAQEAINKIPSQ